MEEEPEEFLRAVLPFLQRHTRRGWAREAAGPRSPPASLGSRRSWRRSCARSAPRDVERAARRRVVPGRLGGLLARQLAAAHGQPGARRAGLLGGAGRRRARRGRPRAGRRRRGPRLRRRASTPALAPPPGPQLRHPGHLDGLRGARHALGGPLGQGRPGGRPARPLRPALGRGPRGPGPPPAPAAPPRPSPPCCSTPRASRSTAAATGPSPPPRRCASSSPPPACSPRAGTAAARWSIPCAARARCSSRPPGSPWAGLPAACAGAGPSSACRASMPSAFNALLQEPLPVPGPDVRLLRQRPLAARRCAAARANLERAEPARPRHPHPRRRRAPSSRRRAPACVVVNPPHGERLRHGRGPLARPGRPPEAAFQGVEGRRAGRARTAASSIGLRPRRRIPVMNGPLEGRILVFDLY